MTRSTFKKGRFRPRYPKKYKGDVKNIIFRSSWEQRFCQFLDNNPNILEWASEEFSIPYIKPTDGRVHNYFPDFWIKFQNNKGQIVQEVIEIKPATQTVRPKTVGKKRTTQLYEGVTYAINVAKWKAAAHYCNKYGLKFRILTENQLFK